MLANIAENMDREPLTTYESARAVSELAKRGFKLDEIAERIKTNDGEKMSKSYASTLKTAYEGVPPAVLKDWEGEHPAATVQAVAGVARDFKTDDEKLQKWDAIKLAAAKKAGGADNLKPKKRVRAKGDGGGSGGTGVNSKRLNYALAALSGPKGSPDLKDETRKWGKAILDFIMKGRKDIPGVPPMPVKAKAAKAKKDGDK